VTLRLLFICHSQEIGGAELYLERLIRHMASEGEERVVCRPDPALDHWAERVGSSAKVTRLRLSRADHVIRLWREIRWASVVHFTLAFPVGKYQLVAALVCRLARRPVVCTHQLVRGIRELPIPWAARVFWTWAFRAAYGGAERHIVPSADGFHALVSDYGFDPEQIDVIPNGVDLDRFQHLSKPERLGLRSRLLGEGHFVTRLLVCTVARLSPQKGLDVLIDAAAGLSRSSPGLGVEFVIIGGGDLRNSLQEKITDLGLEGTVRLLGPRAPNEVAQWLTCADLFVLPSRYEGLPLAMMEAMAAGLPVVATEVSGAIDVITKPDLGLLVPVDDPNALAEAIRQLAEDPELRSKVGASGRDRMRDFTWTKSLDRTSAIIAASARTGSKNGPRARSLR
jgi:glycosyltransferase involved in cell wall biosynthesis